MSHPVLFDYAPRTILDALCITISYVLFKEYEVEKEKVSILKFYAAVQKCLCGYLYQFPLMYNSWKYENGRYTFNLTLYMMSILCGDTVSAFMLWVQLS